MRKRHQQVPPPHEGLRVGVVGCLGYYCHIQFVPQVFHVMAHAAELGEEGVELRLVVGAGAGVVLVGAAFAVGFGSSS